jgi:hypothetical protein
MKEVLRDQQQIELRLGPGYEFGSRCNRNPPVFSKQEVVARVTFTTEPEMFDLNLGTDPMRRAYYPTITKIMKFFTAFRIHTL